MEREATAGSSVSSSEDAAPVSAETGPTSSAENTTAGSVELGPGNAISVARRFLVVYGILLALATGLIGIWVGQQIEDGVLNRTAAVTALYIHSFVAPQVQSLTSGDQLTGTETSSLDRILAGTELGQRIVGFRIWSRDGTVLYSPIPGMQGRQFDMTGDRARSLRGEVTVDMSDLSDPENVFERQKYTRLVEMYVPIRENGSGRVLAVAEFYQLPDEIDAEVGNARLRSWLLVLLAAAASYLLVAGMVLRASRTIAKQESRLREQVTELSRLLSRVADLNARLRTAGAHAEAIAAQERRRISADLHDGPGQALALALLQFEDLQSSGVLPPAAERRRVTGLQAAHESIGDALSELRQIASGLRLPELEPLPLVDVVARAVRDHERRSGTEVGLALGELPSQAPLAVKIGLFRALQETLSNATRHGRGIEVAVRAWGEAGRLYLEVSDGGPGFVPGTRSVGGGLGLAGLRERTALLGGTFDIRSTPGRGTRVRMSWPLEEARSAGEDEPASGLDGGDADAAVGVVPGAGQVVELGPAPSGQPAAGGAA